MNITELEQITNNRITNVKVIAIDNTEEWALAALVFDNTPHLGIRWFNCKNGYPAGGWFIIPKALDCGILSSLTLSIDNKKLLEDFLCRNNSFTNLSELNHVTIN